MLTIAIDVGLTGALATLDEAGDAKFIADLPVAELGSVKWIHGAMLRDLLVRARGGGLPAHVIVEYMHALPMIADDTPDATTRGGGLWAASAKGMVLGSVLAVLQTAPHLLTFELMVPQKWKRGLGLMNSKLTYAQKKQASLDMARTLFPKANLTRQRDHGRAEALLIAYYAHQMRTGAAA